MQLHLFPNQLFFPRIHLNLEMVLQIVLWTLYFLSINVEWTHSWIKHDFLPASVPPHLALLFPMLFIANAFWLVPKYLNTKNWWRYVLGIGLGILLFEVARAFLFALYLKDAPTLFEVFQKELTGNNSMVFGILNVMMLNAFFWSFFYRVSWDWFIKGNTGKIPTVIEEENIGVTTLLPPFTFSIKNRKGIFMLMASDVVYFQAQGDFVLAIDKDHKKHIINTSLKNVFSQLDKTQFFQINRSEIVNKAFVKGYEKHIKNRVALKTILEDLTLYSSNSRTPAFRRWFK